MREEDSNTVSYFALEGIMTHFSNIMKKLIITLIIVLLLWVSTIAGFLWYISLPVEEVSTVNVENQDGNANYIGNDMNGDFNYGEDK